MIVHHLCTYVPSSLSQTGDKECAVRSAERADSQITTDTAIET